MRKLGVIREYICGNFIITFIYTMPGCTCTLKCEWVSRVLRPAQRIVEMVESFQAIACTGTDNSKQSRENTPKTHKVTPSTISVYNKQAQENTKQTKTRHPLGMSFTVQYESDRPKTYPLYFIPQNIPKCVFRQDSARTHWGAYRPLSGLRKGSKGK